jgi:hypothetical protein
MYVGGDVDIHMFFISALVGGKWSASRLSGFTSGERAPEGWVDIRAGLDARE